MDHPCSGPESAGAATVSVNVREAVTVASAPSRSPCSACDTNDSTCSFANTVSYQCG